MTKSDDLSQFSDSISSHGMVPLWDRFKDLVHPSPVGKAKPFCWSYKESRQHLLRAGELISVEEAERRVLILENPALAGSSSITGSLYAGLQLIRAGECAPAHRHTQSALRLILEGNSAYSTVEGNKVEMHPGDVIVTPPWAWHDHGNIGTNAEDSIWLDALDIPTVGFYDASFLEQYKETTQAPEGPGQELWGAGLRPVSEGIPEFNPLTVYPYNKAISALRDMTFHTAPHPVNGWSAEYTDPSTGGPILKTISAELSILPKGCSTGRYRTTSATVFVPIEGTGCTSIGDETIKWEPHDVIVLPSWTWYSHSTDNGAVAFSYSDRAAQTALGLWRDETSLKIDGD